MFWRRRKSRDDDLDREIRSHLELEAEEQQGNGLSPEEARFAAKRALGNTTQIKESVRSTWRWNGLERVAQDLRYAVRKLWKDRAFAVTALLMLSLGIGATTAMFTVIHAVLLKPLSYPDPGRIVLLSGGATLAHFEELQKDSHSFTDVGAFSVGMENMTLSGDSGPEVLQGARVSANFLEILGVKPVLGRSFLPTEDKPGAPPVAMISSELWKRRFGGDPRIAGKTVTLAATPYTIVGVLPPGFHFPFLDADVWLTRPSHMSILSPRSQRLSPILAVFARLKPHVSIEQATAEVNVLNRQYTANYPKMLDAKPNSRAHVKPLREDLVSKVRSQLWILFGAVCCLLLIACANLASLLLARAASRRREFAVRAAIGAGRGRLIAQLLTESILLALIAGSFGVLLAKWSLSGIAHMTLIDLPRAGEIRLDPVILIFAIALSVATGILFGLAPALSASGTNLASALRGSGEIGADGWKASSRWWSTRSLLVIAQIGFSVVLLIGATLLIESVIRLNEINPGFQPANLLTMKVSLPPTRYDTKQKRAAFFDQLVSGIETIPGVQSAMAALTLPMTGFAGTPVEISERAPVNFVRRPIAVIEYITPGYFRTLQIALKRGREFGNRDNAGAAPVAIINESLARRFFPDYPKGQSPIGQHIVIGSNRRPAAIVGIVSDIRQSGLAAVPRPSVYTPMDQNPPQAAMLAIRTDRDPLGFVNAVRKKLFAIDRTQPISTVKTMDNIMEGLQGQRRLIMLLLAVFAGAAMLLAATGIYGVIAYSVVERTKELGIRRALGAQRGDILSLVVGQGIGLALAGVVLGLAGALALTRLMKGLLFEVSSTDPASFIAVSFLFIGVALAASFLPAARAARVDPMTALRYE